MGGGRTLVYGFENNENILTRTRIEARKELLIKSRSNTITRSRNVTVLPLFNLWFF